MLLEVLAMACYLVIQTRAQCPTGCSCIGSTELVCIGAGLTEVPDFSASIRQTTTDLDLGSNLITSIRATDFQGFTDLERLGLSSNRISSIEEGSFSSNTALGSLNLADNELREIPDSLFEFTPLSSLDLNGNLIGNVSALTFIGVQPGASVQIEDNAIRTIPEDTFDGVQNLRGLGLSGNPLRCDCGLRWLPSFINSSIIGAGSSAIGTCDVPAHLNGVSLRQLTEDQFLCNCTPSCINGSCDLTVGDCECDDGYVGETCGTACPIGSFGTGCTQNCTCMAEYESSPCDHVDGTCNCLPGYTGPACDQECPGGFFGQDCLDICQCENGDCDFITGYCNCSIGYAGVACNMICPPLHYGFGCSDVCSCQTGNCHHITGNCSCPIGYFGLNCDHNCTEASDCRDIGREDCSLQTPEQTCGPCLQDFVGRSGNGNSECILCSGAPNCTAINREACSMIPNTCGPCLQRHLTTPGQEGFSNELCFDPCVDGIMNYEETDVDCGGSLCPPCTLNQACAGTNSCGTELICLGVYTHPSTLLFPFDFQSIRTCVGYQEPGNAITERFVNAFRGRENPFPDITQDPDFTLATLEASVEREIQEQFNVQQPLESIFISDLDQALSNPLYQTSIKFSEETKGSIDQMVTNIHDGKLLGTLLLNQKDRKVLHNL